MVMSIGYDEHERSLLISQMSFEKTFGLSSVFIESTLMDNGGVAESANPSTLIKEAIHVISCGYEEKTAWGKEVRKLLLFFRLPTSFDLCMIRKLYSWSYACSITSFEGYNLDSTMQHFNSSL